MPSPYTSISADKVTEVLFSKKLKDSECQLLGLIYNVSILKLFVIFFVEKLQHITIRIRNKHKSAALSIRRST